MKQTPGNREPLVSIITLNYNQAAVTRDFLESTLKLDYDNYEILVCDMASAELPETVLHMDRYPRARLLYSEQNLGFAGGNNWGMRQAHGDFLFIVNNDTELTPELIRELLEPFYRYPGVGVVSPKIRYFSDPGIIQYAGFRPMNKYTGRTATIGDHQPDHGQYDEPGPTAAAHGCAMMLKREVLEKTGMFPEDFFLYYEEWDWSARIHKAGYLIWYQPTAVIYHKESMTVGRDSPLKTYYQTRNRIRYMRRNSSPLQFSVFVLFFTFFSMPKAVIGYLLTGHLAQLKAFLQGVAQA
jgi:GT2 family glycosyltransferase